MFKNYFKIAYRNILRYKSYAFINIMGLSFGLACTVLIGIYVANQLSFDKFHSKSDRIYRIFLDGKMGTNKFLGPSTPAPMAATLIQDYPEVEAAVRLFKHNNRNVRFGEKSFYEDNFFYADSNVFDIFSFKFIDGDKKALMQPNTVIITEGMAAKYFGDENPIGQSLRIMNSDSMVLEVKAVVKEFPATSHMHFDFIASMSSFPYARNTRWINNSFYTYVLLKPGASPQGLESKMPEMIRKYIGPQMAEYLHISYDDLTKTGARLTYKLQKMTDIHLHSNMDFEMEPNGNMTYVYIFIVIAIFILLNACINFTNLSTARSAGRAKEVGLRKVFGTERGQLVSQFLSESVFISLVAVVIAIVIVQLSLPAFGNLVNQKMELTTMQILIYGPLLLVFAVLTGVVAGAYPAFYLSRFVPTEVLKGKLNKGNGNAKLRSVLVVCQFTVSIIILLGTFIVSQQLRYIQNKNMGFDKEKVVVIERTDPIKKDMKTFIEEIRRIPGVEEVSLSGEIPGRGMDRNGYLPEDSKNNEPLLFSVLTADQDYSKAMGIKMKDGRFFSNEYPSDSTAIVINEAAAKYLGYTDAVGKRLIQPGVEKDRIAYTIIGVMKDFHFESLHKLVNPMIIFLNRGYYDGYVTVRMGAGDQQQTMQQVKGVWKRFSLGSPIQYFYFGQEFDKLYKSEFQTRRLLSVFSVLAVLIAVLGLFGLISYLAERRTREIGLRKVLGASAIRIVILLVKDITILVLVSSVIASVVIFYGAGKWLQQFAYRIDISPWLVIGGCALALVIAWLTVGFQAIKAASKNPADSLRFE